MTRIVYQPLRPPPHNHTTHKRPLTKKIFDLPVNERLITSRPLGFAALALKTAGRKETSDVSFVDIGDVQTWPPPRPREWSCIRIQEGRVTIVDLESAPVTHNLVRHRGRCHRSRCPARVGTASRPQIASSKYKTAASKISLINPTVWFRLCRSQAFASTGPSF
jgi:hypothetical protein